jgi:hypothetical protein
LDFLNLGTSWCVPIRFGNLLETVSYETVNLVQVLPEFLYRGRPGTCGEVCDEICNHRACFADFVTSPEGSTCTCLGDLDEDECGNNSRCVNDVCLCEDGFDGNPYSSDGCKSTSACAGGACLAGLWERCPSQEDSTCRSNLQCARQSRSDSTYVCCPGTGPCNDGFECCNDRYSEAMPCPSTANSDCEGSLVCAQRNRFDKTYVCCRQSFVPGFSLSNEPVCRPVP